MSDLMELILGRMGLCVIFGLSPRPGFILIYNSDHPLGAGVNVYVFDHDRLTITSPAPLKGLEQVVLELDQFIGRPAVHRDVFLAQMALTQLDHAQRRKAGDDELYGNQGFDLGLRPNRSDCRQGSVKRRLAQLVIWVRALTADQLAHHRVGKFLRKRGPQHDPVGFEIGRRRVNHVMTRRRLPNPWIFVDGDEVCVSTIS
jgi:hypothetical protein